MEFVTIAPILGIYLCVCRSGLRCVSCCELGFVILSRFQASNLLEPQLMRGEVLVRRVATLKESLNRTMEFLDAAEVVFPGNQSVRSSHA